MVSEVITSSGGGAGPGTTRRSSGVVRARREPVVARPAFVTAPKPVTFTQEDIDAAYARGFLAGGDEAQGDLRRALQSLGAKLDTARAELRDELHRMDHARRDEIVRLAFEVGQWLLQEELRIEPARVLCRIEAALPDRRDDIVVRVAPSLVDVVASALPEVRVLDDATLAPGDVVIDCPDARIDGTVEDALDRLGHFLRTDDDGSIR